MELPRNLSVVSYAVNGRGLGHLSRQVAIHRWLRRYAAFVGVRSQHWFLTTSEADTLLFHEGFAGFKLPSKAALADAGIPKPSYLALAKQWVWHSVALLRPDLFVVDTFPGGSFQELLGVLDLCRHPALVLRPVRPEFARRPAFRALAGLYERVIVPSREQDETGLAEALGLARERLRFVGPIMRGESFERLARSDARAWLGVPERVRCVLVSGGGGGDDGVDELFDAVERALARLQSDDVWLVYAAGPLFRGRPRTGPRRVWWTTPDLPKLLAAFDAGVCAGGFNSVHELGFAAIPTVFVPQRKVADDQHDRARKLVERAAAICIELEQATAPDGTSLTDALREVLDPERGARLAANARAFTPENNARAAARELLALALPRAIVDRAEEELDDALLSELDGLGATVAELVELAVDLQDPRTPVDRTELALAPALELLVEARALELPHPLASRLARLLARRIKTQELGSALLCEHLFTLLRAPMVTQQWSALAMLLDALPGERDLGPGEFVARLLRLLDTAAGRGVDLLGVTRLLLDHGSGHEGTLLYERLQRAINAAPATTQHSPSLGRERIGGVEP